MTSIIDAIYPETLPWELDHTVTDEHNNSAVVDEHRVVICFMSDDGLTDDERDDIIDARGRMIAAAPEMAMALLAIVASGVALPVAVTEAVEKAMDKVRGDD
ncbi:hypothetical protein PAPPERLAPAPP_04430 [Brevundimonas phage vB_BpoS-Papperlapapp]|uniref:Uncharacterized protein n=1 Tax=Brevundimonas phage vB_BpoS-Domovoi TaxID=2948598 RepID=A0A9E7MS46_9CAUD|nr:hypothetical protein DOMOVOI_03380 [Brevundimonas phage vB_BpoS-Domovoi]USN16184.1 hypothetical protein PAPPERLAPAPP_04430 [Brevundimonas phage vB_BpoS-Papperlapapp]